MSDTENWVVTPKLRDETLAALRTVGFAPGGYMGKCLDCQQTMCDVDKRAMRCFECAVVIGLTREPAAPKAPDPAILETRGAVFSSAYAANRAASCSHVDSMRMAEDVARAFIAGLP
jgi:hypothetical protein